MGRGQLPPAKAGGLAVPREGEIATGVWTAIGGLTAAFEEMSDKKSTHKVEVVQVVLELHPDSDFLSIVSVFGGYKCVVRTADWLGVSNGAYLVPDSLVDVTRPEFSFLADGKSQFARIKVKKLRGVISMGLLIPAPEGSQIGDDVSDLLGVTRYEPPEPMSTGGETEKPPEGYHPTTDIEALQRYINVFEKGEIVFVTEKAHGSFGRWAYVGDQIYCGSKKEWKRESESNVWWKVLRAYPQLEKLLREHEDLTVYGEVLGVQDLKYGYDKGKIGLVVFDILNRDRWVDPNEMLEWCWLYSIPTVPFVGSLPFDFEKLQSMADGNSLVPGANHIREGIVIRPIVERQNDEIGRVVLKLVSNVYLSR